MLSSAPNLSLVLNDISCFRGEAELFSKLSFSINSGDILFIRGSNGCGKTSLLKIIAGLFKDYEGDFKFYVDTNEVDSSNLFINFIGHSLALNPRLTIKENIRRLALLSPNNNSAELIQAIQALALDRLINVPCHRLSFGQQKKVSLLRLIFNPAHLWLLDEPFLSLDTDGEKWLIDSINKHLNANNMVIVSSHRQIDLKQKRKNSDLNL